MRIRIPNNTTWSDTLPLEYIEGSDKGHHLIVQVTRPTVYTRWKMSSRLTLHVKNILLFRSRLNQQKVNRAMHGTTFSVRAFYFVVTAWHAFLLTVVKGLNPGVFS